jgi:hypothetical protein
MTGLIEATPPGDFAPAHAYMRSTALKEDA